MIETQKFNAVISFDDNEIVLSAGSGWGIGEEAITQILDPLGTIIHENDGYDGDDYSSPDVDSESSITVALTENSDGDILQGTYTINTKNSDGESSAEYVLTVTYCLTLPLVDVDISSLCLSSSLTSTDQTDYTATCADGTEISATYTRSHTVEYPVDIEGGAPVLDPTPNAIITVTPIYTHIWTTKISTFVEYNLTAAGKSTGDVLAKAEGTIIGGDTHTVACDSCICNIYDCLKQITDNYSNALGNNPKDAERYRNILVKVLGYINLYQIAERCGDTDELQSLCSLIIASINLANCTCCSGTETTYAQLVTALAGTSTSISQTTNQWYYGTGVPSSSLGGVGDFYLRDNGYVYYNIEGSWEYQFDITGDDGADGDAGVSLLWSNTSTYNVTTSDTLDTLIYYDMPYETVLNGDELVWKIPFKIFYSDDVKSGGTTQIGFAIDGTVSGGDGDNYEDTLEVVTTIPASGYILATIEVQLNIKGDDVHNMIVKYTLDESDVYTKIITTATSLNTLGVTRMKVLAQGTNQLGGTEISLIGTKLEKYKYPV